MLRGRICEREILDLRQRRERRKDFRSDEVRLIRSKPIIEKI